MKLTNRQRHIALGIALVMILAISAVSSNEAVDDGVVRPVMRLTDRGQTSVSDPRRIAVAALDPRKISRDEGEAATVDVFAAKSWTPPPPIQAPVAVQPAVPVAPPLPFRYVGQMSEPDGKVIVYLARGEDVYTVKVGDLIEAQYRLDSLDETRATLTYLPMNQQQMLAILPR
jgi:hypothetical protein